jgi:PadR family transcriptional regulator, regulatory protein PadR
LKLLEPDEGKLSRPVLRGGDGRKAVSLPDHFCWVQFETAEQRKPEGAIAITFVESNFPIAFPYGRDILGPVNSKTDVWQGTLALMVLKTLEHQGPLHGYGIARRIEDTSADLLSVNYGTLYPALLKLEQEGYIASEWGFSDNNRKAKFYQLTRAGRKQIEKETKEWEQMAAILARFLNPKIA